MSSLKRIAALMLSAQAYFASAQHVTVPTTCTGNFSSGTDTVLFTVPYNYTQVMSIIGSYKNLTWSGNKPNTVKLNGTNDHVGTARTYNTAGAHVIETIIKYSKPPFPGPYDEVHSTALLTVPSANVSFYIPYDGTTVTSVCDNKASEFNFTAHYCGTNATLTGEILHMLHLADATTVGTFLGGKNFTNCAALHAKGPEPVTMPSTTASGKAPGKTSGTKTSSGAPASKSSSKSSSTSGSSGSPLGPTRGFGAGLGVAALAAMVAVLLI